MICPLFRKAFRGERPDIEGGDCDREQIGCADMSKRHTRLNGKWNLDGLGKILILIFIALYLFVRDRRINFLMLLALRIFPQNVNYRDN